MSQATISAQRLDDLRGSLAAQASGAEQRNRPRALVIGAAIVLVVGAWYAWSGWQQHSDGGRSAEAAQANARKTLDAAGRLKAMLASGASNGGVQPNEKMSSLLSRIEAQGPRAGLKSRVPIGGVNTTPDRQLGWNRVKATYNIKDESLNAVLSWVNMVVEDIPGMEVHSIVLRPEAAEWNVQVVFSRWEKAEGGS